MNMRQILENKQNIIKGIIRTIKVIVIIAVVTFVFIMYNNIYSLESDIAIKRVQIKNEMQKELEMLAEIENITKDVILVDDTIKEEFIQSRVNVNEAIKSSDLYNLNVVYNEMGFAFEEYDKLMRKHFEMFNKYEYIEKVNMLINMRKDVINARHEYYSAIMEYNSFIKRFPNKIIAALFGFEETTV